MIFSRIPETVKWKQKLKDVLLMRQLIRILRIVRYSAFQRAQVITVLSCSYIVFLVLSISVPVKYLVA